MLYDYLIMRFFMRFYDVLSSHFLILLTGISFLSMLAREFVGFLVGLGN
jgi:hypothetical protein